MRVLITQSAADAAAAVAALEARGHEVTAAPLLIAEPVASPKVNLAAAQGFIVTSVEGARALAEHVGVRTFPVFADSALTAETLRGRGFKNVTAANDDSADLARLIERSVKPANGALIYACSTAAPVNLPTMLGNMGFAVRLLPLFTLKRADAMPESLRAALRDKLVDAALFLSAEEARAFVALIQRAEMDSFVQTLPAVAASPVVAAPLRGLKLASVSVAKAGDLESVVSVFDAKLVDRVAEEQAARDAKIREEEERARAEKAARERIAAEQAAAAAAKLEREAQERAERERLAAEKVAAEKAERQRLANEKAEAERLERERRAAEKAEQERLAAERAAAEKAEKERLAHEKRAEKERLERERRAEQERLEKERAEQERVRREREAAEQAERERIAKEKAEAERLERERRAAEKAARERLAAERAAAEKAEKERLAREHAEQERIRREIEAAERAERERIAKEKAEAERLERARLAEARAEQERIAAENAAAKRAERERLVQEQIARVKDEQQRLALLHAEQERVAREKAEVERLERERLAREQAEQERIESERLAAEKAERDRIAREKAEAERAEHERLAREQRAEKERLEREQRAEKERIAREQRAEKERLEREQRAEQERLKQERDEVERIERERIAAEKAEHARVAREKADAEKAERERLMREQAERDRIAREQRAAEKAEQDRIAREKAEAERAERERLKRERAEQERIERERAAAEREAARAAKEEQKRLQRQQKAQAKAEAKAERAAAASVSGGWRARLASWMGREAPSVEAANMTETSSIWNMSTGLDFPAKPPHPASEAAETTASVPGVAQDEPSATMSATIASAAPIDGPQAKEELTVPENQANADTPVEDVIPADDKRAEAASDKPAARPTPRSGGRAARLLAEDAADERAQGQRFKYLGHSEPEPEAAPPPPPPPEFTREPIRETAPERKRSGGGRAVGLFILLAIAAAAVVGGMSWMEQRDTVIATAPTTTAPTPSQAEIDRLQARLNALEQKPAAPTPAPATAPTPTSAPAANAAQPAASDASVLSLSDTMSSQARQLAVVSARLATLEAAIGNAARLEDLSKRINTLEGRSADANSVLALADRVAALETSAQRALNEHSNSIALLMAVAQWREAVLAGRGFALELETAKTLAARTDTLTIDDTAFAAAAARGVATLADLQRRFPATAAAATRAGAIPDDTQAWYRRILERALSIVTIRRLDGDAAGTGTSAILARAQSHLAAGDLAGTVNELNGLSGAAATAMAPWLTEARMRVAAERAAGEATTKAVAALAVVGKAVSTGNGP